LKISKYSLAFELSLGLILLKHNIMAKKEKQDWKDRLNIVYSTNPDYSYQSESDEEAETLDPKKQNLRVSIDRKKRKGKSVTLIEGFVGTDNDLKELAKLLKTKCGVGGSAKDGEIIIQGEFKQKVAELLNTMGYKTKLIGG
jgi:translation initiation factor 1